ncbi:MAG: hypothetical protein JST00_17745 [Deltaproteobacteria bacterium]|nr:hypothetical protein [Deltaproteobacteria bacterium]
MELPYVAFTEPCVYGLDEDGVCREVVARSGASEKDVAAAKRCLGAQYVASLDARVEGLLLPLPKPGSRLLFARMGDDGRIALVRGGEVVRFWSREEREAEEIEDRQRRDTEDTAPFSRRQRMKSGIRFEDRRGDDKVRPQASDESVTDELVTAERPASDRRIPAPRASERGVDIRGLDDEDLDAPTRRSPTADEEEADPATRPAPTTSRGFPPPAAYGT